MKIIIIALFMISCQNNPNESISKKHFWIKVNVDSFYKNVSVNNITTEDNKPLLEEYEKEKNILQNFPITEDSTFRNTFYFKLPIKTTLNDLKNYKVEIKNNDDIIWSGFVYDEEELLSCNFHKIKDDKYKDRVDELIFILSFKSPKKESLVVARNYKSPNKNFCNEKNDKVMVGVMIANNIYSDDPIKKINNIDVNNDIDNNFVWKNYSGLMYRGLIFNNYYESLSTYEDKSAYWNLEVDRNELKDYKLNIISENGVETIVNLNELEFCGSDGKSYQELTDYVNTLSYYFSEYNGVTRLDSSTASDPKNDLNCSKLEDEYDSYTEFVSNLKQDRYSDINITKDLNIDINYHFKNIWLDTIYNFKKYFNEYEDNPKNERWSFTIWEQKDDDEFLLKIPFYLAKEGELKITSEMKEIPLFYFRPIYYTKEHPRDFDYGDYQEFNYKFNKIPKSYGDYLNFEFHFLAKKDNNIIIDYKGSVKIRYFGADLFYCFDENRSWICSK